MLPGISVCVKQVPWGNRVRFRWFKNVLVRFEPESSLEVHNKTFFINNLLGRIKDQDLERNIDCSSLLTRYESKLETNRPWIWEIINLDFKTVCSFEITTRRWVRPVIITFVLMKPPYLIDFVFVLSSRVILLEFISYIATTTVYNSLCPYEKLSLTDCGSSRCRLDGEEMITLWWRHYVDTSVIGITIKVVGDRISADSFSKNIPTK